jgi:signal peptidase II
VLLVLVASGAIGNMIDRLSQNYVVDFVYFSLINFPIFNVADIYVTCSTVGLILAILFYYKEDDFRFLSLKPQLTREPKYMKHTQDKK